MGITLSPWMMVFLILMTGFAGFVDSAAGGGGLISLPAYLFAGLPPHYTYATNKFSAACGTTFATANFFKNGAMNLKVGVLAAIGSFAGSALGAHIVLLLSDELLRTMMFLILPVAAVVILWQRDLPDQNRDDGTLNLKKEIPGWDFRQVVADADKAWNKELNKVNIETTASASRPAAA